MHTGAQACISTPHYRGKYFPLNRGVRQGDVLAPLLYNLAINPIIEKVNKLKGYHIKDCPQQVACLAYADDLLLISNTQEDLQLMCHKLSSFLEHHSININPNKTIYTANVPTIPISIQNHIILPLEENQAFKYLGIWFTANLDWTKSVQCSLQSAIRKLSILKTKKWIPLDTKIFIINNIILKAFEYTANFVPFDDYSSKILSQEIATCIKHSIPMNKLTPSDQIWASEEAGGLALTHTLTLINVAILRTAYRVSLSNTNDLASLSAQARTINDNYLNFIGSPFFSHFPNQDNIKQNPIFCSYYARVAKAAEFLNLNIQCNHNISPFPDDYMTHKYLADKLNSFNVQINQLIINKHLVSYNELHKLAPTITTNDYQVLKADVPNIIHKQASKLKGSAPFKLTPQNLSPTTCTIWNSNNVLIWTDGSTHIKDNNKNIHDWGVFFKQGSGLNTWKRTNLEFDITSAELTAIEHALSVAPLSQHTTIFSDSLNAVNFIKDSPSWPLPTWNKCPYSSTLYRISCLIKQRKNLNNLVQIHHVYSHIEDKRKKWPKHKLHLLDEQEKHLNTLFPNFYKHIIEGNCQADILAAKATLTSKTHYLLPPNPVKYTLIDKTTGKQVFNLGAQGKFIQARTWNDILLSRKGPTLGCHKTARKAVNSINKDCFWIKLNNLSLATQALTHKYQHCKHVNATSKCNNPDCTYCDLIITKDTTLQLSSTKNLDGPNCPFCTLNTPETTIHCIGECPAWEHIRLSLLEDINKCCLQAKVFAPSNFILNSTHNYSFINKHPKQPLYKWDLYPQLSASLGLIPLATLNKMYGSLLNKQEIYNLNHKLTTIIINRQHEIYKERNKLFHELVNR
jgi:hypothetical protein